MTTDIIEAAAKAVYEVNPEIYKAYKNGDCYEFTTKWEDLGEEGEYNNNEPCKIFYRKLASAAIKTYKTKLIGKLRPLEKIDSEKVEE